ncbi:MAG: MFS transporter [Lewinellaceae bacterium]|nr:MFS transporter [Lewinellaceae bacterium]
MLAIQKNFTKTFYALLSLPATAMGFALSVQISALSWILSTQYGLEIHDVGLVWAAGPIAGIFGQVIIGLVSDNVWFWNGRRRPFILIGGVLAALMLLALPNIGVISASMGVDGILGIAIVVALTLDLAINVSFNPTRSIIADVTPPGDKRTKGYTWMQTISGTLGVAAYAIGAIWGNYVLIYSGAILVLLLSIIPPFFIEEPRQLDAGSDGAPQPAGHGSLSLQQIFMAIQPLWGFLLYAVYGMTVRLAHLSVAPGIVEGICAVITVAGIAAAMVRAENPDTTNRTNMAGFQKVLAAHSFTWIGVQTMFVYMFAYVQDKMPTMSDLDMGRVVSISFLILNAVGALLPALLLEPLTRRLGRVRTHMICIAIMAAGYAGIWFVGKSPTAIYLLMGVLGVGWAATVSLPFAIMSQKVNQGRMGLYMGLFNLSVVLPQLVASLGVGEAVSKAADKNLIFIICAGTLAVSAFLWLFVQEPPAPEGDTELAPGGGGH